MHSSIISSNLMISIPSLENTETNAGENFQKYIT
jgi:hypothetical protein